jgi:hypothetical protein
MIKVKPFKIMKLIKKYPVVLGHWNVRRRNNIMMQEITLSGALQFVLL